MWPHSIQTWTLQHTLLFQIDLRHPPTLSPPVASILSDMLLYIWGRGWQSCSPPADHVGCPLWWKKALSIHQEQSAIQTHSLHIRDISEGCYDGFMPGLTFYFGEVHFTNNSKISVFNQMYHKQQFFHWMKCVSFWNKYALFLFL